MTEETPARFSVQLAFCRRCGELAVPGSPIVREKKRTYVEHPECNVFYRDRDEGIDGYPQGRRITVFDLYPKMRENYRRHVPKV